jgi:hypothetical protein
MKNYKQKQREKTKKKLPRNITKNGIRIYKVMKEKNQKGNYKDFVLFIGNTMIDRYATYTVAFIDENTVNFVNSFKNLFLLHKSKLRSFIEKDLADKLWDYKSNMRTNYGLIIQKGKDEK